jgi:oxalate decarboxylase/phosphoglucose isomerase-like protein (cupin superfamily)
MRPERQPIRAGMLIHIPADVYHETINTTWEPLRILAVYAPPGPEAILRAMPECRIVPAGELPSR